MAQALAHGADRNLSFEARAIEHLRKTHHPESLDGLDWTHAAKEQPFTIIYEINLKPDKRPDRLEAPCPLCSPYSPKYYHGALVWFPSEGVYRCIGWDCAAHHIGRAESENAKREYRERKNRDFDAEFLFMNLGCIPAMLKCFEALLPAAVHAEKLRQKLGSAHVREPLRKVYKNNDGRLVVWQVEEVDRLDPLTGGVRTIKERTPISFGKIDGWAALAGSFDFPRKIRVESEYLKVLDQGEADEAELWVCDNAYKHPDNARIACRRLREANALYSRSLAAVGDVLAFFNQSNFERIRAFGYDSRNTIVIYAKAENGNFRIGPTSFDNVLIRPDFKVLTALPAWPELRLPANG